jgi:NADH dehydrogenase
MRAAIFGGGGFIGRSVAACLSAAGWDVIVPTRDRERAKAALIVLPTAQVVPFDPLSPPTIRAAAAGCDVVINLIGILQEARRHDFEATHVEFVRKLVEVCARAGPRHLIHISALNAGPGAPSRYLRTKGNGEAIIREVAPPTRWTIIRPSVVFGRGDGFVNLFAAMLRRFPMLPLACAEARFQPIGVEDLARLIAKCAGDCAFYGETLQAGGPRAYSLGEIAALIAGKRRRLIVPLNRPLSYLLAWMMEAIPFITPPLTRDNCASMSVASVCARNDAARILGDLRTLEAELQSRGIGDTDTKNMQRRYDEFRHFARR